MARTGCSASTKISTHAPAGGATQKRKPHTATSCNFYSRPCGRGDRYAQPARTGGLYFYSRPCGRGDQRPSQLFV